MEITLGEAAARTGLHIDMPIPIANNIIYHYITIKDSQIIIDETIPPIDMEA